MLSASWQQNFAVVSLLFLLMWWLMRRQEVYGFGNKLRLSRGPFHIACQIPNVGPVRSSMSQ